VTAFLQCNFALARAQGGLRICRKRKQGNGTRPGANADARGAPHAAGATFARAGPGQAPASGAVQ